MLKKQPRVQVYLDLDVYESLQKVADSLQTSLSKSAARMIEKGMNNHQRERSDKKTHLMLTYLLASVYDNQIAISNTDTVKELIKHIESKIEMEE